MASLNRICLEGERIRAEVLPALGAGLGAVDVRGPDGAWHPLMRRAPQGVSWFNDLACYFLAPWPNRVADGRFTWRGQEHRVAVDWPDGTAIHGLVKEKPWRIAERTPLSAVLRFDGADHDGAGWPWPLSCRARYELLDDGLSIGLSVRNTGEAPMPAGAGFHPFFMRKLWDDRDDVELNYAPRGHYTARGMIPTGPARADELVSRMDREPLLLRNQFLDDVFSGSTDGAQILWPASGVRVRYACSANLGHGVVYTGEAAGPRREFFCFEPVSMVNDGFNLHARGMAGSGVVELNPGEELATVWTVRVDRIPAPK